MLSVFDGAFTGLQAYLKLGIPSAIMTMSEFVIYEVMTLMAAYISSTSLATISVVVNIISIGYETTGGLSTALTSLIGRLLGEEKPNQAKKVAVVGFAFHFVIMTFFGIILLAIPKYVSALFTFQQDIVNQFRSDIIVITILFVCDATMSTMSGVIKGISMQSVSSVSNIICYYLISIPAMYVFCFSFKLGLFGIFLGYDIGCLTNLGFMTYLIVFKEWKMYDFRELLEEESEEESEYQNLEKVLDESTTSSDSSKIQ